jgi:hypothetical protein
MNSGGCGIRIKRAVNIAIDWRATLMGAVRKNGSMDRETGGSGRYRNLTLGWLVKEGMTFDPEHNITSYYHFRETTEITDLYSQRNMFQIRSSQNSQHGTSPVDFVQCHQELGWLQIVMSAFVDV